MVTDPQSSALAQSKGIVNTTSALPESLTGVLHIFVAFDWGEEVDLARARKIIPPESLRLTGDHQASSSITYRPPPIRFNLLPVACELPTLGRRNAVAEAIVFDFAAASVALHVPFTLTPSDLSQLAASLSKVESLRQASAAVLRPLYEQLLPAIQNPLWGEMTEEYFVFEFSPEELPVETVYPLAILCRWLSRTINHNAPGQQPTEEEVLVMADLAAQGGTILPDELRWVENVLRLNDVTVHQLMTPRQVVFSLPAEQRLDSPGLLGERLVHSRIPVTAGNDLNQVIGVVQRRTVFDHIVRDDCHKTIRELMRPALFVSEDWGAHQLLDRLMKDRQHLAVVTDSVGLVVGVATLEDVLEYLLGKPIVGEHDSHPEMQRLARERASFRDDPDDDKSSRFPS